MFFHYRFSFSGERSWSKKARGDGGYAAIDGWEEEAYEFFISRNRYYSVEWLLGRANQAWPEVALSPLVWVMMTMLMTLFFSPLDEKRSS